MKGTPTRTRGEAKRDQSIRAMGVRAWISQRTAAAERKRHERQVEREKKRREAGGPLFKVPDISAYREVHTGPVKGSRDRRLAGKKRIRARREASRAARS